MLENCSGGVPPEDPVEMLEKCSGGVPFEALIECFGGDENCPFPCEDSILESFEALNESLEGSVELLEKCSQRSISAGEKTGCGRGSLAGQLPLNAKGLARANAR